MANQEHFELLKQGVEIWNKWRIHNLPIQPDLSGANFSEANLSRAILSGANFSDALLNQTNFSGANLSGANFSEANLSGANLSGATFLEGNLSGANLSGANLSGANLRKVDLSGAIFKGVDLRHVNLREGNLSGADLSFVMLNFADLTEAELSGCYLNGAHLSQARLMEAKLNGAHLSGAILRGADLNQAHLSGADLNGTDLSEAKLNGADLSGAYLNGADLNRAKLRGACLCQVGLSEANLSFADLSFSNLSGANLNGANLLEGNLSGANLSGANLSRTILVKTKLHKSTLTNCRVYGIAAWDVDLAEADQSSLIITDPDSYEPIITVDNLKIAQFIYLLLNNKEIRDVINTVGQKAVLILGRFGGGGHELLHAIAAKLREMNYLPIIFDFERPDHRDFTETIMTLAGLSRFVIANLSGASVPNELRSTIPHFKIPFVPIIEQGEKIYSMFPDLLRYPWVLSSVQYTNKEDLLELLPSRVIEPAEEKFREVQVLLQQLLNR